MTKNTKKKVKAKSNSVEKTTKQEFGQLQQTALDRWWERKRERVTSPKFEKAGERKVTPTEKNPDKFGPQLLETTGSTDADFSQILLVQASSTFTAAAEEDLANFTASFMHGLRPRDEMEGVLIAQMAGTHNLIMEFMKRAVIPEQYLEVAEEYTNRAYKLLKIFLKQVEALQKYRGRPPSRKS